MTSYCVYFFVNGSFEKVIFDARSYEIVIPELGVVKT